MRNYRCWYCGYEGLAGRVAHSGGLSTPFCRQCGLQPKEEKPMNKYRRLQLFALALGVACIMLSAVIIGVVLYEYAKREPQRIEQGLQHTIRPQSFSPDIRHCLDGPGGVDLWDCIRFKDMKRGDI